MAVMFNDKTNVDRAWVTAALAVGETAIADGGAVPIAAMPSPLPGNNLIVQAQEGSQTLLHANMACAGASVLNDSGARILWGWVGSDAGCVVPLDDGESWTLPMANLNMIEIESSAGSGPLDVHVVVIF